MMKKVLLLSMLSVLLLSCSKPNEDKRTFILQGAWLLRHMSYPTGLEEDYSEFGNGTVCHIYDTDSVLYECSLTKTPSGLVITPHGKVQVTLINKGGGELLYLENEDPHPLSITTDSTITIQRQGVLHSMVRANDIYQEWGNEIRDIIINEMQNENATSRRYVLSAKERQQEKTIHWFALFLAFLILTALVALHFAITNRKAKRQLQLQLRQIQEVQENRPQVVRQAVMTVENIFFASDDYVALQKRMANGQRLKEEEYANIEELLKTIYPGFTSQLRSLYPMSELEYLVCLLIKLRIAPKEIASVLSRDISTISTVRSRLYKKVFGRKGSTKEWDDFILSMDT